MVKFRKGAPLFPSRYALAVRDLRRRDLAHAEKAPTKSIDDSAHHAQAYSYAIHRDVRVDWYALWNGREFGLYNVADVAPAPPLRFSLSELRSRWGEVHTFLWPDGRIADRGRVDKDFGILLLRLGTPKNTRMHFLDVPLLHPRFGYLDAESVYRLGRAIVIEGQRYHVSYDFDADAFRKLVLLLDDRAAAALQKALELEPAGIQVTGDLGRVHVECQLGEFEENDVEQFIPLRVLSVRR